MKEHLEALGVDITSAGFLHNPQELFHLSSVLNTGKPEEEWVQLELYPTLSRPKNMILEQLAKKFGLPRLPVGIETDSVHRLQENFPNTKISRVHLPFFYSFKELIHRMQSPNKRNLPGFLAQKNLIGFLYFFGLAANQKAIELASKLQDQKVGVNIHPTVIEGFARDGKLDSLKSKVAFVLAENDCRHDSIYLEKEETHDPVTIVRRLVNKYHLDGLLLGLDHEFYDKSDVYKALLNPEVTQQIRAMHLAKADYSLLDLEKDIRVSRLLSVIKRTKFDSPVRIALENYPQHLVALDFEDKVRYFQGLAKVIKETKS